MQKAEEPRSTIDGAGTISSDNLQLLRYAEELQRLHTVERHERTELEALQASLARADAQQLAIVADFKRAYEAERRYRQELHDAYLATIRVLAAAVEARDHYTGGHIERVRGYSWVLGQRLGLGDEELRRLDVAAILHDVGKIGVPDAVLTKPGALDDEVWRLMKRHPTIGAGILRGIPFLVPAAEVVVAHHERWDGAGYPRGLKGEEIPLHARIIAVADSFDAMTTDRVYRSARGIGAAVEEVERSRGSHFDAAVVEVFLDAWRARAIP